MKGLRCAVFSSSHLSSSGRRWATTDALSRRFNDLVASKNANQACVELRDALKNGSVPPKAVSSVLFLCESQDRVEDAVALISEIRRVQPSFSWDERSLAVIMRLYKKANDVTAATHLLGHLITNGLLKHRTVSPYLELCCCNNLLQNAGAAYIEAKKCGIQLEAADFTQLVKLCANTGDKLDTLGMLLEDASAHLDEMEEAVFDHVALWTSRSSSNEASASRTSITSDGTCKCCNMRLRGHDFTLSQKSALLHDVATVVAPKTCRNVRHFETFARFLSARREPVDVFVDGLNVGFYGLSSWYRDAKMKMLQRGNRPSSSSATGIKIDEAALEWDPKRGPVDVPPNMMLIDKVIRHMQSEGKRCLLILPQRHTEVRNITPGDEPTVARWQKEGLVFSPATGLLDDLCWVFGALYFTRPSDVGNSAAEHHQPVSDFAHVVTNDKMRDHLFKLLSSRAFSRWRDEHQITFKCERVDNETNFIFSPPRRHSRCIQRDKESGRWHVPLKRATDGEEEEGDLWACIRC